MKKLLQQLRHKVVLYVFNYYYHNFLYGFEKADQELKALPEPKKTLYYENITDWLKSQAYEIESRNDIRQYYEELATKVVDQDVLTAYRLLLLYIKSKDIRLRMKMEEYQQLLLIRRKSDQIK